MLPQQVMARGPNDPHSSEPARPAWHRFQYDSGRMNCPGPLQRQDKLQGLISACYSQAKASLAVNAAGPAYRIAIVYFTASGDRAYSALDAVETKILRAR